MSQFRFIIVDPFEGYVSGTNDKAVAEEHGGDEDLYVIDTETGKWFDYDVGKWELEITELEESEDEDDEDAA